MRRAVPQNTRGRAGEDWGGRRGLEVSIRSGGYSASFESRKAFMARSFARSKSPGPVSEHQTQRIRECRDTISESLGIERRLQAVSAPATPSDHP
jgi:hypothetical protein